jgi:hypothetical protein
MAPAAAGDRRATPARRRHRSLCRHAKVIEASIQWNYITVLNIIFLILAAALCCRFVRTGGIAMLKMMGGAPETAGSDHAHTAH